MKSKKRNEIKKQKRSIRKRTKRTRMRGGNLVGTPCAKFFGGKYFCKTDDFCKKKCTRQSHYPRDDTRFTRGHGPNCSVYGYCVYGNSYATWLGKDVFK